MRQMLLHPLRFMREHRFTQSQLSDYLDGELYPRGRHRIEHHAGLCPKCRHLLQSLKLTLIELTRLRASEPDADLAGAVIARLRHEP